MSRRRKSNDTLPFDTIKLEGSLFVPELLERAARGEAGFQKEADYAIPKGLKLHDEYGRAFRIATASWQAFAPQTGRTDLDAAAVTRSFVIDLLRQCLGYTDLAAQDQPLSLGDRGFPVTALALGGRLPVIIAPHSLGLDDPDPRFAIIGSGAKKKSAHQLAQEFLNASQVCLWAIVTNGKALRLLRDADTLTRPNFLEFDLETILRDDQQRYADFSALWRILHASRAGGTASPATDCIWEKWKSEGHSQGLRVRAGLRDGVTQAILVLGNGFLKSSANEVLRQRLQDGFLTKHDYFQQLLRLIYRCLFLFCAEERDLLHAPNSVAAARQFYATGYSLRRFRQRSLRLSAYDPHGDLWDAVKIVFYSLSNGQEKLALPALGGLFAADQCPDIDTASLSNRDLLAAMRDLRWFFDKKTAKRSAIDYRNMGPEELGSVYESLLELVPTIDIPARTFGFVGITDNGSTAGNTRKTTGSYYTPDSLVQELIKSALDPVIARKIADHPDDPIAALLSLSVIDPACGSGHFLIAAARRLAEKLAELRAPDGAVTPPDYRHALREVISHCIYGVDIKPMTVELCKFALWLESVDPGKPLGFLNHHIRLGNSMIGATPDLIAAGLPDGAFTAIEGDETKACSELKIRNQKERDGFGPLFTQEEKLIREKLRQTASFIEEMDDSLPELLREKATAFANSESSPEYQRAKLLADIWCAAFVCKKGFVALEQSSVPTINPKVSDSRPPTKLTPDLFGHTPVFHEPVVPKTKPSSQPKSPRTVFGITTATLRQFVESKKLPEHLEDEVTRLSSHYQFFHWHLAFPQVFEKGGFDCSLGNPPWDTLSPDRREFFSRWVSGLRSMPPKEQDQKIDSLLQNPMIATEWEAHCRDLFALVSFLKNSGVFTLYARGNLGKGDFNIYRMFTELALRKTRSNGSVALVLPGGIYGGANASAIRKHLLDQCRLTRIYGLINTKRDWFEKVDIDRFAAFVSVIGGRTDRFEVQFGLTSPADLKNPPLDLEAGLIRTNSPDTYAIPDVRDLTQLTISRKMFAAHPPFGTTDQGTPVRHYSREIDMGNDRDLFSSGNDDLPVYEGRMIDHFDHCAKTYVSGHGNSAVWTSREFGDPDKAIVPQWRVPCSKIPAKLGNRCDRYRLGFGDVANPRNQRSFTACLIPPGTICGDKVPTLDFGDESNDWFFLPWLAVANSFAMDWLARTRLTSPKMAFSLLDGLPFPRPSIGDDLTRFASPIVLRLIGTSPQITPFWNRMATHGFVPPCPEGEIPDLALIAPDQRAIARSKLDAYVAKTVFGLTKSEMAEIMDTFAAQRNADIRSFNEHRAKRLILEAWDDFESKTSLEIIWNLPTIPRAPLPQPYQYVVSVMTELLIQSGSSMSWNQLRTATDLLKDRAVLASQAKPLVGNVADSWLALEGDRFDATQRFDQLSGLCTRGRMEVIQADDELVVRLLTQEGHPDFPHVRFDARLALAVVREQELNRPIPSDPQERSKVASLARK